MSYSFQSESLVINGFQCNGISQVLHYLRFNDLNLHINTRVFTANSWLPWQGELVHFERVMDAVNLKESSDLYVGDECLVLLQQHLNGKGTPRDVAVFKFNDDNEAFERYVFDLGGFDDWLQKGEGEVFTGVSYNQILIITNDFDTSQENDDKHEKRNATCVVRNNRKPYQIELSFTLALKVTQLSVGHDHAIALAANVRLNLGAMQVFTWGCNTKGELGLGPSNKSVKSEIFLPVELLDSVNVVKVAAGGWHSSALTADGDVYFWGWNESGQLGVDPEVAGSVVNEPTLFNLSQNGQTDATDDVLSPFVSIIQVALGSRHSVLLDTDNNVWVFGWNEYGQCATKGTATKKWKKPHKLIFDEERKPVSIGAAPWASILVFEGK